MADEGKGKGGYWFHGEIWNNETDWLCILNEGCAHILQWWKRLWKKLKSIIYMLFNARGGGKYDMFRWHTLLHRQSGPYPARQGQRVNPAQRGRPDRVLSTPSMQLISVV